MNEDVLYILSEILRMLNPDSVCSGDDARRMMIHTLETIIQELENEIRTG